MKILRAILTFLTKSAFFIVDIIITVIMITMYSFAVGKDQTMVDDFSVRMFFKSPFPFLLIAFYILTFIINFSLQRKLKYYDVHTALRLSFSFVWMQIRIFCAFLWFLLLTGIGYVNFESEYIRNLIGLGIWIGLVVVIAWFLYGKIMRGRIENIFIDKLSDYAEANDGSTSRLKKPKQFIMNASILKHSTIHTKTSETVPLMISFKEPFRGFALHCLTSTVKNMQSKIEQTQKAWTFCVFGDAVLSNLSGIAEGEVSKSDLFSFLGDKKSSVFRKLQRKYSVKRIEFYDGIFLVSMKGRFDILVLNVKFPDIKKVISMIEDFSNLFNRE